MDETTTYKIDLAEERDMKHAVLKTSAEAMQEIAMLDKVLGKLKHLSAAQGVDFTLSGDLAVTFADGIRQIYGPKLNVLLTKDHPPVIVIMYKWERYEVEVSPSSLMGQGDDFQEKDSDDESDEEHASAHDLGYSEGGDMRCPMCDGVPRCKEFVTEDGWTVYSTGCKPCGLYGAPAESGEEADTNFRQLSGQLTRWKNGETKEADTGCLWHDLTVLVDLYRGDGKCGGVEECTRLYEDLDIPAEDRADLLGACAEEFGITFDKDEDFATVGELFHALESRISMEEEEEDPTGGYGKWKGKPNFQSEDDSKLWDRLVTMVVSRRRDNGKTAVIKPATWLYDDLCLTGDDMVGLLKECSSEFGINLGDTEEVAKDVDLLGKLYDLVNGRITARLMDERRGVPSEDKSIPHSDAAEDSAEEDTSEGASAPDEEDSDTTAEDTDEEDSDDVYSPDRFWPLLAELIARRAGHEDQSAISRDTVLFEHLGLYLSDRRRLLASCNLAFNVNFGDWEDVRTAGDLLDAIVAKKKANGNKSAAESDDEEERWLPGYVARMGGGICDNHRW